MENCAECLLGDLNNFIAFCGQMGWPRPPMPYRSFILIALPLDIFSEQPHIRAAGSKREGVKIILRDITHKFRGSRLVFPAGLFFVFFNSPASGNTAWNVGESAQLLTHLDCLPPCS